jgi:hypothetical protein
LQNGSTAITQLFPNWTAGGPSPDDETANPVLSALAYLSSRIGTETDPSQVVNALSQFARLSGAAVVGAHQVCCSDETEREIAQAFDRGFVGGLLPPLKRDRRGAFRSTNLGARYEWGSVRIAEEHYVGRPSQPSPKLLVLKINSHVGVRNDAAEPEYGSLDRYGTPSTCCGALAAMLAGADLPAVDELRHTFGRDGASRCESLVDPNLVDPKHRALLAAVANAWLQARQAVEDIHDYQPEAPSLFLVLACVTINRSDGPDTELIVGQYGVDHTGDAPEIRYQGLGGDPTRYRVDHDQRRVTVGEEGP